MSTFPEKFRLDGRTALITGSARGLGWEMAKGLAEAGARVLLHGRSHERLAPRLVELRAAGRATDGVVFGMADRTAMKLALADAGPVDILIHNVGERDRRPFTEIESDDFARLVDTDLSGGQALIRLVVPGMVERGWGRLILVTSIAATLAAPGASSYIAAKAGLEALARALASELGATGVTSNALSPASEPLCATAAGERIRLRCRARRWVARSDIAGAAIFLASPAASYVNGHTLTVDGGVTATYVG